MKKFTSLTLIASILTTCLVYFCCFNQNTIYVNHHPHPVIENLIFQNIESPKNIILFIGDGMGQTALYAAMLVNNGKLNIAGLSNFGFSKTHSSNNFITDSAAGGSAIAAGKKTKNKYIGVDATGKSLITILELAEARGLSTGLIATSTITHATPASFIAHTTSRDNHEKIAEYFLKTKIDIFIGGGRKYFIDRKDKRDLSKELSVKGYNIYDNVDSITGEESLVACFTSLKDNPPAKSRGNLLEIATRKSLQLLSKNPKGFFLMVEGSHIDFAGHKNDAEYLLSEILDMDKAVGAALEFYQEHPETLIIVTADHETGGITIVGGDMKNNKVVLNFSSSGHTAVSVPVYAEGPSSELFRGHYENTEIFNKMKNALKFDLY